MIRRNITENLIANFDDTIQSILSKIDSNKLGVCFIINEYNRLIGIISDGDIRRLILKKSVLDLDEIPAKDVCRSDFVSYFTDTPKDIIIKSLSSKHKVIPLVNRNFEIISYVSFGFNDFKIGDATIGGKGECYIIAEIGNNHQGSLEHAKKLIDAAVTAGANSAKFQMRNLDELYLNSTATSKDLGTEYTIDLLRKFQLSNSELFQAFDYCHKVGIEPLCTPWDVSSLRILDRYGLNAFKLASADLTNLELIEEVLRTGKPIITSTGMATETEIRSTANYITNQTDEVVFLHCNSTYPAPFSDVNLSYINNLKKITGANIGYSSHERGTEVPIAAVALGATVLEKHLSLNKAQEGSDHKVSLLPNEFTDMCRMIRNVEVSLSGPEGPRVLSQGEMLNRHNLGKSLIAARPIKKGSRLTFDDIAIASPGSGLHPKYKHLLIGRTTERTFQIGDLFFDSDLKNKKTINKSFNYERPFGIPVRYHDFELLTKDAGVTLIEFHLSYKDIELDVNDFLNKKYEYQLVVHCPELFANDHLLDLASSSKDYRSKSIDNVNRTLDLTRRLNGFFVNQYKTPFVINVGGWSTESFVDEDVISEKIDNLEKSILNLDLSDVELSVQTMPPFPWHFGGQAFHNLFVKPEQIISLAKQLRVSICLDTSHTMMAANYYGFDFYDAVKDLLRYASHLHISDAEGIDGEGTNLCDGDINFYELSKILNNHLEIGFIPEIWQGHLDFGAKFWSALNQLEQFGLN